MDVINDAMARFAMNYREHAPSPALADMVDRYWFFRTEGTSDEVTPMQQCIPLGMSELILILRGVAHFHFDGGFERLPDVHVVGVQREPVRWTITGDALAMGVRLKPEAAIRLYGMPLKDVSPLYTDAAELLSERWRRQFDPLFEMDCEADVVRTMETFLMKLIGPASGTTERFISAVQQLRSEGLGFDHRSLGDKLSVCDRQAQRLFKEHLGLSPVHYHRIYRFRQAYDRATAGRIHRWSDLAYDLGYSDQAHFIRDFRAFSGITPGMLTEGRAPVFLLRGRLAATARSVQP